MALSLEKLAFIARHGAAVRTAIAGTGILASVAMAQMILESSGKDADGVFRIGRGLAVRKANNYFGIKANSSWTGRKVLLPTPKDAVKQSWFRVYDSALDSIRDHARFIQQNPRYAKAGVFAARTAQQQADALDRAGYAGDSKPGVYVAALLAEIAAYDLTALDLDLDDALTPLGLLVGAALVGAGGYCAYRMGLLQPLVGPLRKLLPVH